MAFACGRCAECDGGRGFQFCVSPRGDWPIGPSDGEVREQERIQSERSRVNTRRAVAHMRERCAREVEDTLSNYVTAERMAEKIRALSLEPSVEAK